MYFILSETYHHWSIFNGKQRITDNLPLLKFLCLRFYLQWERLPGFYYDKKLPFGLSMRWAGKFSLRRVSASLISIIRHTSKLRLLSFEVRGYVPRRCYTRGWSFNNPAEALDSYLICEHLVKYHIPEYEPLLNHARSMNLRGYYSTKRDL